MNKVNLTQAIDFLVENNFVNINFRDSFEKEIRDLYNQEHRYYHNINHIEYMLNYYTNFTHITERCNYYLTCIMHDAIYYPNMNDNEEQSVLLFRNFCNDGYFTKFVKSQYDSISDAIMATKEHKMTSGPRLSNMLINADMGINTASFDKRLKWHYGIFKEYQLYEYSKFKEKRIEFLQSIGNQDIDYVENFRPKVGLYCGSFSNLHLGHIDVLKKSQKIFDKVIIAIGINADKKIDYDLVLNTVKSQLPFHEVILYNTTLQKLYDKLNNNIQQITIIRGVRNSTDLLYEQNLDKFVQRPLIYIPASHNLDHISSSALNSLQKVDPDSVKEFLIPPFKY